VKTPSFVLCAILPDMMCSAKPLPGNSNGELPEWRRSDLPQSARAIARFRGSKYFFKPFEESLYGSDG
jgi:hypothetical protein